jgi:hypothetical protein
MAMPAVEDRLLDLLVRWDELRRQGRDATADDICSDCPELAGKLRGRIEARGNPSSWEVRLWETLTGKTTGRIFPHQLMVRPVAFSPDGGTAQIRVQIFFKG